MNAFSFTAYSASPTQVGEGASPPSVRVL